MEDEVKGKCECCKERNAKGYIRTFKVCHRCYYTFKLDNKRRIRENINIPKKLVTLNDEGNKIQRGRAYGSRNKVKKGD